MNLKTKKFLSTLAWWLRIGPPYVITQAVTFDLEGNKSLASRRVVAVNAHCLKCGKNIIEPIKDQPEQVRKHFREVHQMEIV